MGAAGRGVGEVKLGSHADPLYLAQRGRLEIPLMGRYASNSGADVPALALFSEVPETTEIFVTGT